MRPAPTSVRVGATAARPMMAGSIRACGSMEETQMRRKRNDGLLILAVGLIVCLWAALRAAEQPPPAVAPPQGIVQGPVWTACEPDRAEEGLEADVIDLETIGQEQDPGCLPCR
jgi:hypothetical protein